MRGPRGKAGRDRDLFGLGDRSSSGKEIEEPWGEILLDTRILQKALTSARQSEDTADSRR